MPEKNSNLLQAVLICRDNLNSEFINSFFKQFFQEVKIIAVGSDVLFCISVIDKSKVNLVIIDCDSLLEPEIQLIKDDFENTELNAVLLINSRNASLKLKRNLKVHFLNKPLSIPAMSRVLSKIKKNLVSQKDLKIYSNNILVESKLFSDILPDFIAISHEKTIQLISITDVEYMKAQGKYTCFYLKNNTKVLSSQNIGFYEYHNEKILRIHQSYIVNLDFVKCFVKEASWFCYLKNGTILPVSRRRKENIYLKLKLKV